VERLCRRHQTAPFSISSSKRVQILEASVPRDISDLCRSASSFLQAIALMENASPTSSMELLRISDLCVRDRASRFLIALRRGHFKIAPDYAKRCRAISGTVEAWTPALVAPSLEVFEVRDKDAHSAARINIILQRWICLSAEIARRSQSELLNASHLRERRPCTRQKDISKRQKAAGLSAPHGYQRDPFFGVRRLWRNRTSLPSLSRCYLR
jgi:hypothetical protein